MIQPACVDVSFQLFWMCAVCIGTTFRGSKHEIRVIFVFICDDEISIFVVLVFFVRFWDIGCVANVLIKLITAPA